MTYYWLSFCDDTRPKGEHFLGGCLVEADYVQDAVLVSWEQECNPGGEVQIIEITPPYEANVARFRLYYLYSEAELMEMGEYRLLSDAEESGDVT